MLLHKYLTALWLSEKEIQIFSTVLQYWTTNASKVANHLWRERTSTYKLMKQLASQWYLTTSSKNSTTTFSCIDINQIKQRFTVKQQHINDLAAQTKSLTQERSLMSSSYEHQTTIKISEWAWWLDHIYQKIITLIKQENISYISSFASATFESSLWNEATIQHQYHTFLETLTSLNITTQSYLWTGLSLMEQLLVTTNKKDLADLPLHHDSIQVRLIGEHLFIMLFKKTPQIIHIHNTQLAALMHFIWSQLERLA